MSEPNHSLKPAAERVVAKVIDGEAIIMDIQTGVYHSLEGVGAFIWEAIERGLTLEAIVRSVVAQFDVTPETASRDLAELAQKLQNEGIVTSVDGEVADVSDAPESVGAKKAAYAAPSLQSYHDMGDLLALDPPAPSASDLTWED